MDRISRNTAPERGRGGAFVAATVVIFFLSISAADSVGFVPCYLDGTCADHERVTLSALPELGRELAAPVIGVRPERIVISEIGLDLPVQNPETRDIAALDEVLKSGPARYVDSALLEHEGNILIFAHSSHLPVVKNEMYKAFNRIPELAPGDSITLEASGKIYLYTVTSLKQVDAEDAAIDLSPSLGKKLTLVTCDTLTGKTARYVLEADFVAAL